MYLAAYLLTLTYAKSTATDKIMTIISELAHPFADVLISPPRRLHVGAIDTCRECGMSTIMKLNYRLTHSFQTRAALVSTNVFSLLCDGDNFSNDPAGMRRFGSPIVYLIVYGLILFGILVYVDSGTPWPAFLSINYVRNRGWRRHAPDPKALPPSADVIAEAEQVEHSEDPLRVSHVSKTFPNGTKAVDDVSLGVGADTVFAMLGPNGAGQSQYYSKPAYFNSLITQARQVHSTSSEVTLDLMRAMSSSTERRLRIIRTAPAWASVFAHNSTPWTVN